ncbi:MAG: AAA family ATPase, partial [Lachnospiraceae bacterium]|nr:AAA family ATPase [Lachnospiraceae bacterium]
LAVSVTMIPTVNLRRQKRKLFLTPLVTDAKVRSDQDLQEEVKAMERDIMQNLEAWKDSPKRKPLLLTGVRQCGKTYVCKQFGERYFEDVAYYYFENDSGKLGFISKFQRLFYRKLCADRANYSGNSSLFLAFRKYCGAGFFV